MLSLGVSLFPTGFLVVLLLLLLWQSGYIPFSVSLLSHYFRKVKKRKDLDSEKGVVTHNVQWELTPLAASFVANVLPAPHQ